MICTRISPIILAATTTLSAQNLEADPNYMFAAVLGSGFYRVEDASLTVVRIPFSKTLGDTTAEQAGLRLLLPMTVGYASLDPEDLIDRWQLQGIAFLTQASWAPIGGSGGGAMRKA